MRQDSQALHYSDATLDKVEATFRQLLEEAPDAALVSDHSGRILLANHMTERLFGYERDELIGQTIDILVPERHRAGHVHNREQYYHSPAPRYMGDGRELFAQRKDGSEFAVEISLSPMEVDGVSLVTTGIRDVTKRKRAEAALQRQTVELERSNAELQQFAYVASHDLQEPLRMVASYAQLLERRYGDSLDQDAREFIEFMVDGARRMQDLINDLLAFSRVGTRAKPFAPTDSKAVIAQALRDLGAGIEESGAEIVVDDDLPVVDADAVQLGQVFRNLFSNAIKFRSDAPPRIRVSARPSDAEFVFEVGDNGIGMEGQYAERIFLLFQRLHTKREYPGTGIGLAICKKIVERHGGRIWVESVPGQGSGFFFTIPRAGAKGQWDA